MEETLLLNNDQSQTFDFKLDVEGIDPKDALVRFAIDDNGMFHSFPCEKREDGVYSVYIPAMPFLEKKTYPCKIEVVIDGYFFIPMTGNILVAERPKVTVTPVSEPGQTQQEIEPKKTPEEKQKVLDDLLQSIKPPVEIVPEETEEEHIQDVEQEQIRLDRDERVKKALDDLKTRTLNVITAVAEQTASLPNTPSRSIQINELIEKERRVREILDSVQQKELTY